MFAIGDAEWPGISKLVEECGEVLQVCGKLMGTGGEIHHWDGEEDLKTRLQNELADLLAAAGFVGHNCGLDLDAIVKRTEEKLKLFVEWHVNGIS